MNCEPNETVCMNAHGGTFLDDSFLSLDPQKIKTKKQFRKKEPDKQIYAKIKQALCSRRKLRSVILKDLNQFCLQLHPKYNFKLI